MVPVPPQRTSGAYLCRRSPGPPRKRRSLFPGRSHRLLGCFPWKGRLLEQRPHCHQNPARVIEGRRYCLSTAAVAAAVDSAPG